MEKNKKISQPSETDKPSASQRAKEKKKDFATGWHIQSKKNKQKVQAESSQEDHAPSDSNPHSERQMSNEGQPNEIAHPESRLRNASGNEMEGKKVLWLGQDTREMEKFLQERYESAKQEAILYGEQQISASEVNLAEHNERIENSGNQTSKLEQTIEDLDYKMHTLWIKSLGYKGVYLDLEKEWNFIEAKISHLKGKWAISHEECASLETEINDLNSKIVAKKQKQKELLFHFNKLIEERNKTQEEYNGLTKDTETQLGSQSKEIINSQKKLWKRLKKDLGTYRKNISKKEKEKQIFEEKLKASDQVIQKIRVKEREISELQIKKKIAEKTISCVERANSHFSEKKSELEKEKANFVSDRKKLENKVTCLKAHKNTLEALKDILEMDSNDLMCKELQYHNACLREQLEAFKHYEGISKENRESLLEDEASSRKMHERHKEDKKILESKKKYHNALSEYIECYESEIGYKKEFIDNSIENIEYRIKDLNLTIKTEEDRLENQQKEIKNYEMFLRREALNKGTHAKNRVDKHKISNFTSLKEDELTHFEEQLTIIKEYSNNDIEQLRLRFRNSNDQIGSLQDEILINEDEKLNLAQIMQAAQIGYNLYSEERKTIIQECKLYKEDFQEPQISHIHKNINAQDINLLYDKLEKKFEYEQKIQSECKELRSKMIKPTEEIEKLDGLINKLRKDFEEIFYQESEAQEADHLVEAGTEGPSLPHGQCSRLTSLKDIEPKNRLLAMYIEKRHKYKEELYNLGIELLQKKDEIGKNLSDRAIIAKEMWNYHSGVIKTFQSNLGSLHITKSIIQTKINAELTEIASQFETDLQNLQKSYNEKTSELESVQSELTALTNSVQQEKTKRQELQDKLDKLASQVNATHHESETITQELEDHCQKLEKSSKEIDAAEQKKLLLKTEIEIANKKLKVTEEEMKSTEDKWKEKYSEYKEAESESMHLENICEMTKAILEKAENYKKAKDEYENALLRFENMMPRQITLPYWQNSFTKERPLDKWLAQALEKAEKARIGLSNARTELF